MSGEPRPVLASRGGRLKHPGELRVPGRCALVLCAVLAAAPAAPAAAPGEPSDVRRDATVLAVEKVMPSVVNIATRNIVPVRDPFQQYRRYLQHLQPTYDEFYTLGSGVVIDEAGYLLTNEHVVRNATQIAIRFGTGTNDYEATIVDSDPIMDVALLQIKAHPGERFQAIKLAPEGDLLLGETVLAFGNPLGHLGGSVARGILSSKSRRAPVPGERLNELNYLQTDAAINFGNSGGPLVNLRGELIGINVAKVGEVQGEPVEGIGFAIPIRLVEEALADLFPTDFVKSYWFGARVKVGTSPLVITTVDPISPAGRAGLRPGDLIARVNGQAPRSFIEFANLLVARPGAEVNLSIEREGQRRDCAIRLVPEKSVFNADLFREKLGLEVESLNSRELASRFGLTAGGALLVSAVEESSPAARAGLQIGMLIFGLDDHMASDITSAAKLLHAKKPGEPVQLTLGTVQRAGNSNTFRQFARSVPVR